MKDANFLFFFQTVTKKTIYGHPNQVSKGVWLMHK